MQKNKGLTLIELMIIVAIIGIVAAVVIPMFTKKEPATEKKIGEISGCQIFSYKPEGIDYPIFLAKCDNTATVTSSFYTGGKTSHRVDVATVTIAKK